jgi:hypothetical protein
MVTADAAAHPPHLGKTPTSMLSRPWFGLLVLVAPLLAVFLGLFLLSRFRMPQLQRATEWFDPMFLLYNTGLALFAVLIVPVVTYFYVRTMKEEKRRRLKRELGAQWDAHHTEIERLLGRQFRFRNYLGSLVATMGVVATGAFIILLLKPYFPAVLDAAAVARSDAGVNYGRGANILLLGPWIEAYPGDLKVFYHQIVISLTAFQFGFLGAYVYFMGQLLRSYFTLDLSTHTLVAGTIRIATSSVLALVLSFALFPSSESLVELPLRLLPVLAFFLGHFPQRALVYLESLGDKALRLKRTTRDARPLALLAGMSSEHESRLEREGFDSLENLSHSDAVDLAVRTGFGYKQLRHWIGEARLRLSLEEDYDAFANATWIRTCDELEALYRRQGDAAKTTALVAGAFDEPLRSKMATRLTIAAALLAPPADASPAGG